jgi:replication initiator protein
MDTDDLPLFQPTPLQRRLIDAAVEIEECTPDTVEFLHAVLCQVGLPRRVTKERVFERNNGRASIRVEAGALYKGGKWIEQPLPCGAKPRLALIHVSSEDVTVSAKPIERFEAWLQYDGRQRSMWPGVPDLSQPFFETLISHAVPLDPRAIHGLKKSALALDVYTWLAHRLCRVRKPGGVKLSWGNLRQQFGQEYACSKDFKKEFKAALLKVRAVYPGARIDEEIGGLRLYSSPAPVPKSQVVVQLPAK